ncbi:hypothetical protein [Solirubrobacter ginsenosidimutans]|nr:hypothetical protein [Solirubrobacter ginsenosidimutans]
MRGQRGQTTADWMGILLVISAICLALFATGINTQIADNVQQAICRIIGKDCSAKPPVLSECVVNESSDKVTLNGEFNVRFFKVKLEGGVEYVRQLRANGQVAITVKLPTSGGIGPPLAKELKMGAEIDGTVKAGQTPQVTFVLPSAKAADKFEQQVTDSAIAIAAGPIGSRILGKKVDIDVPPVESIAYELTGGGNASIGVDSPGGYASGSIDLGQALGIRKNLTHGKPNSGDITAYYKIDGKLKGEGGLLVGEGVGGALAGDETLAVTFTSDGKPKALTVTVSGSYEGKLQLQGKYKDLQTALGAVQGLDIKANQGDGQKIQIQLDLPLDNPDIQNATLGLLRGINPVTGGPADTAAAAAQLKEAVLQNAKAQVRTYDTSSSQAGAKVDLGVGGGGVTFDANNSDLTGAMDYVPGQGFVPSQVCVK